MKSQALLSTKAAVGLVRFIAKCLPPQLGYLLGNRIAVSIANLNQLDVVKSVRLNQWIVSGKKLSDKALDLQVKRVFKSTARSLFDFYHYLDYPQKIVEKVELPETIVEFFRDQENRNAVFVATHLSNFDLVGQALGIRGYRFQILSYPGPSSGYAWQNKIRKSSGHLITPTSIESLRQARIRLQNGGNILTGLDRPISSQKYRPNFFGYPSSLPVAYTKLALQTNTPVIVVSAVTKPDGSYYLYISKPVTMKSQKDQVQEALRNTEAVLEIAEDIIAAYSSQWSMFYSVWPEQAQSLP